MAEGYDGVHAGGSHGGEHARDDADQREDREGDQHDGAGGVEDDVAVVVGGLVDGGVERHGWDQLGDDDRDDHADDTGDEGQHEAFEEELGEDVAAACAEGLHEADLAGALGDRDEHDVHDADAADGKRHRADDAEQNFKRERELHDGFRVFDGVPGVDGFFVAGVEVVALGEDGADGLQGAEVKLG